MPSPPPCNGDAATMGTCINATGATITAVSLPHGAVGTSEIVLLLNDDIGNAVDAVVVIFLSSTTYRGEYNAFGRLLATIGTSWSSWPLIWVDDTLAQKHQCINAIALLWQTSKGVQPPGTTIAVNRAHDRPPHNGPGWSSDWRLTTWTSALPTGRTDRSMAPLPRSMRMKMIACTSCL